MFFSNPIEFLSPSPLHLLVLLVVLSVFTFRTKAPSSLRRWRYVLLAAVAWCWLATTPVFANWLVLELENDYPPIAVRETVPVEPAIIVLAGGAAFDPSQKDGLQLNLASYRRTQAAVELWHRTGGTLVFAGSIGSHEAHAVSARMAVLAMKSGVPPGAIRVETQSMNTHENLRRASALIERGRQVVIVTSAMHMPRAMAVAQQLEMHAIAAPADFRGRHDMAWWAWLPNSGTRPVLDMALHEWLGRAWYAVRGWT